MSDFFHDELINHMIDFLKLFYDGHIQQLYEYAALDPIPSNNQAIQSLKEWFEHYKTEDLATIENYDISIEALNDLKDKYTKLFQLTYVRYYKKHVQTFNSLSVIYYNFNMQAIKKAIDDVQASLNLYSGAFKETLLIHHESFEIRNFYIVIPPTLSKINTFLSEVKGKFDFMIQNSMKNFVFSPQFMILQNFMKNIENKDFSPEEMNELRYNWSVLILKGFYLSQINLKLFEDRMTYFEKPPKLTEEEYQILMNISCRIEFSQSIMNQFEINEPTLIEIFNKHSDPSSREVLVELIQNLIPYYKSLTSAEGYIKLTFDKSKEYEKLMKKLNNTPKSIFKQQTEYFNPRYFDDFMMYDKYVFGLYIDHIPFTLYHSPSEGYNKLFNICMKRFNYTSFMCEDKLIKQPKSPCDELFGIDEIPSNLNDLINQKYFIVHSFVKKLIDSNNSGSFLLCVNTHSAALILSLLPWKIDRPSEEAKKLESRIIDNIRFLVKNSKIQNPSCESMTKFIIKHVWKASKPLNLETLRSKIEM